MGCPLPGAFSRPCYPGAPAPRQENLVFDNVRVLYDSPTDFLQIRTPIDVLSIANSSLRNNRISFLSNQAMTDYVMTRINLTGCILGQPGKLELMVNQRLSRTRSGGAARTPNMGSRIQPP